MAAAAIFGACKGRPGAGAGGDGAGGAGGSVTSSGAAAPSCTSCWSYLGSEATPASLCGFDAATQSCAPSTSCARVIDLSACLCGGAEGGGQCVTFCELSCSGVGIDDGCEECMQTLCAASYEACAADAG
jgi:hypothetical protein